MKMPPHMKNNAELIERFRAQRDEARVAFKHQIASLRPDNPNKSCTVSKGIWYDRTKNRFRVSIGSYRSKWFHTQEGAEIHRAEKKAELDKAKRIAKIKSEITKLTNELQALEEQK